MSNVFIDLKVVQARYWLVDEQRLAKMRLVYLKPSEFEMYYNIAHLQFRSADSRLWYRVFNPQKLEVKILNVIEMLGVFEPTILNLKWWACVHKQGIAYGEAIRPETIMSIIEEDRKNREWWQ